MITARDVHQFLQKKAEAPAEPIDVRPEPGATGAPGRMGRLGGWALNKAKNNLVGTGFLGLQLYYGAGAIGDAWKQWDVNKETENQLAQYAQQINTLEKEHPFLKMMQPPKTDFQKDVDEHGYGEASFRHAERSEARAKANAFDEKQRSGGGGTANRGSDPAGKDFTMTGQFQRAYNTKTVPVTASRYQRG